MKKVTKLFLVVIAIFSLNAVFAQPGNHAKKWQGAKTMKTPAQKAQAYSDTLKNVLNLTEDQYSKVQTINTDFITKRDELRKSLKIDSTGQVKTQIESIKKDRSMQINKILTPAQQATWKAWKKEQGKNRKASKGTKMEDSDGM